MPVSINPATEKALWDYTEFSKAVIEERLARAAEAADLWAAVPIQDRSEQVRLVASALDLHKERLALLITREMGKPISESRAEIDKCAWVCRYYGEHGPSFLKPEAMPTDYTKSYVGFRPLGTVLAVMPWNFPFWQVFRFAAPALVAGNTALLKHASNVTGCALAIEDILKETGLPEGTFQVLVADSSEMGSVIADDRIKAVTLTGSEPAGKAVASAAGKALKKSVLELGGSDPYLILEDADLEETATKCAQSRLLNGGQSCISAKRFIAVESVHDRFLERLTERMEAFRVGDPENDETRIGPMARKDLRDELHQQVIASIDAGAVCMTGRGPLEGKGYYYTPTVLSEVTPEMAVFREETFGPVAAVIKARDTEEAIGLANDSSFGLGSAVFTRDIELAESVAARIQSGNCFINDFVKSDPRLPFGGIRKSGYGRELSQMGIREFVNAQTVVVA